MLHNMPVIFYLYAAILFGGGLMGFVKANSANSLIGSGAFAAISIVAGILTRSNPSTGLLVGILNALAVAGFFMYRYVKTQNPMPAFPTILLSLIVLGLAAAAFVSLRRSGGAPGA